MTDNYGRKLSISDSDSGQRRFIFNGFDELSGMSDANQNSIALQRDALGRVVERDESVVGETNVPPRITKLFWDGDGVDVSGELIGTLTHNPRAVPAASATSVPGVPATALQNCEMLEFVAVGTAVSPITDAAHELHAEARTVLSVRDD